MKTLHSVPLTAVALGLALWSATGAHAQTAVSVNFIGNTDATQTKNRLRSTQVAGVVPVANWNNDTGNLSSGTVSPVNDSTGVSSGATFSFTAYDAQSAGLADDATTFASSPNYQLMNGFIESGPTTNAASAVLTVGSVPYATYDLYVYMFSGVVQNGNTDPNPYSGAYLFQPSGGGSTTEIDATRLSDFSGTFVDASNGTAGNYIVFRGLSAPDFTLTAQSLASGTQQFVPINGIQIVSAAPEPAGWLALTLGVGVLGLRAIRGRRVAC